MPRRNDPQLKVVALRRDRPDLKRLAQAIVALALRQLESESEAAATDPPAERRSPPPRSGAAA
jgi:hypothetical protein